MGAANQKRKWLEANTDVDNEYYGLLLNEALKSGKIEYIPNEPQARFEVLDTIMREVHSETGKEMRDFRARHREETENSEKAKKDKSVERYSFIGELGEQEQIEAVTIELASFFEST